MYKFEALGITSFHNIESVLLSCHFRWQEQIDTYGFDDINYYHLPIHTIPFKFPAYIIIKDGIIKHSFDQAEFLASDSELKTEDDLFAILDEFRNKVSSSKQHMSQYRRIMAEVGRDYETFRVSEQSNKDFLRNFEIAFQGLKHIALSFAYPNEPNVRRADETIDLKEPRSIKKIVDQTNEMARSFYALMGYTETREDFRFWQSTHPTEMMVWKFACIAQAKLTNTDPDEMVGDYDESYADEENS